MWKSFLIAAILLPLHGQFIAAQAEGGSCTLQKGAYTCDWQAFRARFAQVHTVAIEAPPMDRGTEGQLRHLIEALGKSVATSDQPGELTFRVVPANASGIAIGPADQFLASLQVYARAPEGGRGALLWVETFVGQADRPWPMVVTALTNQFQSRFGRLRR